MKDIIGKTLVFTDQHFGIKSNAQNRQKIGVDVIRQILKRLKTDNIENVIFCGDYFHVRSQISVDTINIAYKCMQALAAKCRVILILGNHDLFMKNSVDINSLNMFQDIPNVEIVSKPEQIGINSKNALLVPWLSDLSVFKPNTFDFIFGHFEISSKFLIKNYVEEHSGISKANSKTTSIIDDEFANIENSSEAVSNLGSFIELAKRSGVIFAGHIHQHKEHIVKGRKFIFVGSPYQQNLGDIDQKCGYYVIDETGKYSFTEILDIPKHVQFKCSKILETGIDKFDFSDVKNNIVQKIYDIDVSASDDTKINQKITDMCPYEELLPDYQVKLDFSSKTDDENNSIDLIRKSKLEYIKNYIDNISDEVIKQNELDKDKLFKLMSVYYSKVSGDEL